MKYSNWKVVKLAHYTFYMDQYVSMCNLLRKKNYYSSTEFDCISYASCDRYSSNEVFVVNTELKAMVFFQDITSVMLIFGYENSSHHFNVMLAAKTHVKPFSQDHSLLTELLHNLWNPASSDGCIVYPNPLYMILTFLCSSYRH